ncbi:helix-turn-helix protein [Novosphingobium sp. PhB165]|uniref:helix-turn-helix domain-containing protein n=1 Tax=Novosphingobium sp. PhB165 TaxID=2485105 RepID=UPI001047C28E|nr:helix-turn-helix domain-containing protein [Novosphingobium sp. PhB165]TCM17671.1 helix-turn-helix protein [Novosphingobium sp. PhB165]
MSTMKERWGQETMRFGFTGVPNLLLRVNALEETKGSEQITPAEMFVLLVILAHWIDHRVDPFPSIERISRHTGLSGRHVRRIIRALIAKNYLISYRNEEHNGRNNFYSLKPIVERLTEAADRLDTNIRNTLAKDSITQLETAERLGFLHPVRMPRT